MKRYDKKTGENLKKTLKELQKRRSTYGEYDPEYLKNWRHSKREKLLAVRVPTRTCPICEKVKVKSRQWLILKHNQMMLLKTFKNEICMKARKVGAICRACAMKAPFRKLLWNVDKDH